MSHRTVTLPLFEAQHRIGYVAVCVVCHRRHDLRDVCTWPIGCATLDASASLTAHGQERSGAPDVEAQTRLAVGPDRWSLPRKQATSRDSGNDT